MEQHEQQNNHGPIASIRPDYITKDYLELILLDISDFEGKNVVSIWWWFWMLEMDLAKNWTNVQIVDPIYNNKKSIILKKIKEQIIGLREIENKRSHTITLSTQQNIVECLSNIQGQRVHLNDFHDNYKYNKLPMTLTLNPSSWEDIKWIESDSQDYIFINNVLFHCPEKINNFLSEADKILKPWGTIFIIDYKDDLKDLQKYFINNGTHKTINDNSRRYWAFCWSIKKWEYKQVETFLKEIKIGKQNNNKYVI